MKHLLAFWTISTEADGLLVVLDRPQVMGVGVLHSGVGGGQEAALGVGLGHDLPKPLATWLIWANVSQGLDRDAELLLGLASPIGDRSYGHANVGTAEAEGDLGVDVGEDGLVGRPRCRLEVVHDLLQLLAAGVLARAAKVDLEELGSAMP